MKGESEWVIFRDMHFFLFFFLPPAKENTVFFKRKKVSNFRQAIILIIYANPT